jgi:predicted  nucleic acid-binding Zn-ribbon protein
MVEDKLEELSNVLLELMEKQKMLEKEMKYLRDDLKAQNRLLGELLKVQKVNQETENKQTKMLEKIAEKP